MPTASDIRRASLVMALCCIACGLLAARASAAVPRKLFAEGAREVSASTPLWLAQVEEQEGATTTSVLMRGEFGANANWSRYQPITARALGLTTHGSELVIVLDQGSRPIRQWAWLSPSRYSLGPWLPDGAEIIAMAGGPRSLWALGRPGADRVATTAPSTAPVAPVLYELDGEKWKAHTADWPAAAPSADGVSMVLVDGKPTVGVLEERRFIQILQYVNGGWVKGPRAEVDPLPPMHFELLEIDQQPAVWVQPQGPSGGIGGIWMQRGYFPLALPEPLKDPAAVAVTVAGSQIRAFFIRDGKLLEQRYRMDGAVDGQPLDVKSIPLGGDQQMQWITIAVMAVLTVMLLNALFRRRVANKEEDEE